MHQNRNANYFLAQTYSSFIYFNRRKVSYTHKYKQINKLKKDQNIIKKIPPPTTKSFTNSLHLCNVLTPLKMHTPHNEIIKPQWHNAEKLPLKMFVAMFERVI